MDGFNICCFELRGLSVKFLQENSANVNVQDWDGLTGPDIAERERYGFEGPSRAAQNLRKAAMPDLLN